MVSLDITDCWELEKIKKWNSETRVLYGRIAAGCIVISH